MQLDIRIETGILKCSLSTLRVWLVLIELTQEYGNPLIQSFAEISRYSNVCRRVSARAVSKALKELEELKMVSVKRRGNISIITIEGLPMRLPTN